MVVVRKLEYQAEVKDETSKGLKQVDKKLTQATKKKREVELEVDIAKLEQDIKKARETLKDVEGTELEIQARVDLSRLRFNATELRRNLRNLRVTGDENISRLGQLFDGVTKRIDKTIKSVGKLGKEGQSALKDIQKEAAKLQGSFAKGEIGVKEFEREVGKLDSRIDELRRSADKNASLISKSFQGIKTTAARVGTGIIAGFGLREVGRLVGSGVKQFADFEKQLAVVNTVARVSKKELDSLGEEIKDLGEAFGISKTDLADTAFNIASAGIEFENIIPILELSAKVAQGANTDTTTAFNGIIAVIKGYGLNLQEATKVADLFFKTNELGQTTIEDISKVIGQVGPIAKVSGISLEELFGVYSTLTGVIGDANKVTTGFEQAILSLTAPTTEARNLIDDLGIQVGKAAIEEKGFVEVAKELFEAVNGDAEALRKLLGSKEAVLAVTTLVTTQYDKYTESTDKLTNATGSLDDAVNELQGTTAVQLAKAREQWNNFLTDVGEGAVTVFGKIADLIGIIKSLLRILSGGFVTAALGFGGELLKGLGFEETGQSFTDAAGRLSTAIKEEGDNIKNIINGQNTDLKKLGDERNNILSQQFGSTGGDTTGGGGGGGGGGLGRGGRSQREKEEAARRKAEQEARKRAEEQKRFEIKNARESFLRRVDLINKLETEESKKVQLLEKAEKDLGLQIEKIRLSETDFAIKQIQREIKERKEQEEERKKQTLNSAKLTVREFKDATKALENYGTAVEGINKKFDDLKTTAQEAIEDINKELADLDIQRGEDLGSRFVEVGEELNDARNELRELEQKSGGPISLDEANRIQELREIIKARQEEQKLISDNTTEEERAEAIRKSQLSPAEQILEEIEAEKLKLEEKKAIQEQELLLIEEKRQAEIDAETSKIEDVLKIFQEGSEERKRIEEGITTQLRIEGDKRIEILKEIEEQAKRTASALGRAGVINSNSSGRERVRQISNINNRTNNNTFNVENDVDVERLERSFARSNN